MRTLVSTVTLSSLLCFGFASVALAGRPDVINLPPVEFDDPYICGGDPVLHVAYTGTFKLTMFFDNTGTLVRDAIEGGGRITVTFSDPESGRSLTGSSPAPFRTTYNADGSVGQLRADGLNAAITIPGEGVVLLDTGSLTWDGGFGGPVLAERGPHGWFASAGTSAFCAYFQG
jgi:hypothetical protein